MRALRYSILLATAFIAGCAGGRDPMQTVDYVDLDRFMGDWYVIASIPTFLEKNIYNAVETYELDDDGTIATTFVYRKDSFDGKQGKATPRGFITNTETNATWGMRFVWPIKADYRVVYLDEDYTKTIIGREKRDYVWVMARSPQISDEEYSELSEFVESIGYDISELKKVPQQW